MKKPCKGKPFPENACDIDALITATAHVEADIMIKHENIYSNIAAFFILNVTLSK